MTSLHSLSPVGLSGLLKAPIGSGLEHWGVIRFAMLVATCYATWLTVFERWLEPFVRRVAGHVIGRAIVWVPAVGRFRIWGLRGCEGSSADAVIALLGQLAVIVFAAFPAAVLHVVAGWSEQRGLVESSHLASIAMTSLFVLRVLSGKPQAY